MGLLCTRGILTGNFSLFWGDYVMINHQLNCSSMGVHFLKGTYHGNPVNKSRAGNIKMWIVLLKDWLIMVYVCFQLSLKILKTETRTPI